MSVEPFPCGTNARYCAGCRCDACREAGRQWRAGRQADPLRRRKHLEAQARYRAKNVERDKAKRNAHRAKRLGEARDYVRSIKAATPCADCGGRFPYPAMDFDHLPDAPRNGGSTIAALMASAYPVARLAAEIAKCEVVCANCHRLRTQARRGD